MTDASNPELGALAAINFDPADSGATGALPGADAGQDDAAQSTAQLDAAVSAMALGLLRTARTLIARKLPEIQAEWTDDVLRMPADALPPVLKRYAGQVSEWAARFPELVGLGVACMPMMMGYMAAVEAHAKTVSDVAPKPAPAPEPAVPAGSAAVFHVG